MLHWQKMVLFAILVAVAIAQDPGRVEGRVLNAKTGEPLRKALVNLLPGTGEQPVTALTDASGSFVFSPVKPGKYVISTEKDGFVLQSSKQKHTTGSLELTPGGKLSGIELSLLPQGVITGRVVDEDGDPISNSFVTAMRYSAPGSRRPAAQQWGASSNDIGEFRIANLLPGRYLLRAAPNGGRGLSSKDEGYAPMFHPSAMNPDSAVAVEVNAGAETAGTQIQLRKVPLFRVRGVVAGLGPNSPAQPSQVILLPDAAARMMGWGNTSSNIKADGTFEFLRVAAGTYQVFPTKAGKRLGKASITVSDANIDNFVVPLREPVSIRGKVRVEDGAPALNRPFRLFLVAPDGSPANPFDAEVKDGMFEMSSIPPDVYRLDPFGSPFTLYVKSVRSGERDLTRSGIDLNSAGPITTLEVVLGNKPGAIECMVKEDDKPSVGRFVSAVPMENEMFAMHGQKSGYTGPDGVARLTGLAPGNYMVFAWDEPVTDAILDRDFLKQNQKAGVRVTVSEGAVERVEAKLIIVN